MSFLIIGRMFISQAAAVTEVKKVHNFRNRIEKARNWVYPIIPFWFLLSLPVIRVELQFSSAEEVVSAYAAQNKV